MNMYLYAVLNGCVIETRTIRAIESSPAEPSDSSKWHPQLIASRIEQQSYGLRWCAYLELYVVLVVVAVAHSERGGC